MLRYLILRSYQALFRGCDALHVRPMERSGDATFLCHLPGSEAVAGRGVQLRTVLMPHCRKPSSCRSHIPHSRTCDLAHVRGDRITYAAQPTWKVARLDTLLSWLLGYSVTSAGSHTGCACCDCYLGGIAGAVGGHWVPRSTAPFASESAAASSPCSSASLISKPAS